MRSLRDIEKARKTSDIAVYIYMENYFSLALLYVAKAYIMQIVI